LLRVLKGRRLNYLVISSWTGGFLLTHQLVFIRKERFSGWKPTYWLAESNWCILLFHGKIHLDFEHLPGGQVQYLYAGFSGDLQEGFAHKLF